MIKESVPISGYCPFLEANHTIFCNFSIIESSDSGMNGTKLVQKKCSETRECNIKDNCPLIAKAKSTKF